MEYGFKVDFGEKIKPRNFHIIGIDVILDSDLNPWLLEINANPSLQIDFDSSSYGEIA